VTTACTTTTNLTPPRPPGTAEQRTQRVPRITTSPTTSTENTLTPLPPRTQGDTQDNLTRSLNHLQQLLPVGNGMRIADRLERRWRAPIGDLALGPGRVRHQVTAVGGRTREDLAPSRRQFHCLLRRLNEGESTALGGLTLALDQDLPLLDTGGSIPGGHVPDLTHHRRRRDTGRDPGTTSIIADGTLRCGGVGDSEAAGATTKQGTEHPLLWCPPHQLHLGTRTRRNPRTLSLCRLLSTENPTQTQRN
jgi:hypothetical protein